MYIIDMFSIGEDAKKLYMIWSGRVGKYLEDKILPIMLLLLSCVCLCVELRLL